MDNEQGLPQEDFDAPGWDAITEALNTIYGDQEPLHYGTVIKYMMGGPDPIDGVSIYRSEKGSPHWHYVSYGFTELYRKESTDPEYSGFGFELTMRLKRDSDEPPVWTVGLMQNLARYVFSSGNVFDIGHYLDCNGPIALDTDTKLAALIFAEDCELKEIQTTHGKVVFVQMFGVTLDELQAAKQWSTKGFLGLAQERVPFLVVDLDRDSLLDETFKQKVKEGIEKEGSNTGSLFVSQLNYKVGMLGDCQLTVGAQAVSDLKSLIPARIKHGRELLLAANEKAVRLRPGEKLSYKEADGVLNVDLPTYTADALSTSLEARDGEYKICKGLTIKVLKTEIKNAEGQVVDVIG